MYIGIQKNLKGKLMSEEQKTDGGISSLEAGLLDAMTQPLPDTEYQVTAGEPLSPGLKKTSREAIIEALKTVSDPEIMVNIWDLGLVYDIRQAENGDVEIDMTVTAPNCPVAGVLPAQAAEAVAAIDGVGMVTVKLVWEPEWTFERMSDDAKMMFELF